MSVMNAGKKSKALVRPLRAGNSRAGERPGRIRASEPGAAASRPEKRNVPGVSAPARPDKAVPGRPRATGKSPARPRLWAVPDVARQAIAGSGGRDPGTTSARDTSASANAGPATAGPATAGPAITGPAGSGPRMGGGARPRRLPGAGSIPLVPRPRMAPDDLISPRPTAPRAPTESPGRPRPGARIRRAAGLAPGWTSSPSAQRRRSADRDGRPVPPGRAWSAPLRSLSPASRAYPADQAHPARPPGPLGGRDSPPRRGHHPAPARRGLRRPGVQPRPAAVRGPGGHAAGSSQARPVPVVGRAECGAQGRPAGGHSADHGVQRAGQPGCGARREPLGPPGLMWRAGDRSHDRRRKTRRRETRRRETRERSPELISPPGRRALDPRRGVRAGGAACARSWRDTRGRDTRTGSCGRQLRRSVPGAPGSSRPACVTQRQGFSWPSPDGRRRFTGKSRNRRVAACAAPGVCSSVTTTSSSYSAVVHV